jgi:hypothetical protein
MASDQGSRQGRTGQAGLQVARLLAGILDPAARRRGFAEASLLADWAAIVGPALARRCQPVRVDHAPGRRTGGGGGTLVLQASGAAAVEIQHAAPQLLERINTYFGHRAVRQLRLLQMPLPPPAPEPPPPRAPSPADEAALAAGAGGVADAALREALLALGRAVGGARR